MNLYSKLKSIETKMAQSAGDDYILLEKDHAYYSSLISGSERCIQGNRENILEKEAELKIMEQQCRAGELAVGNGKDAKNKREYANLLKKVFIPQYQQDVRGSKEGMIRRCLVLSGVAWEETTNALEEMLNSGELKDSNLETLDTYFQEIKTVWETTELRTEQSETEQTVNEIPEDDTLTDHPDEIVYKTAAFLFSGVGGATVGAMRSQVEYSGKLYKFKVLCAIDSDPVACSNHDLITGEKTSVCMDLFKRWQYEAWHGQKPPEDWQEATAWDIWQAFKEQVPFFLFLSPPCKGLSGLLPASKAASEKYQALNYLTVHGLEMTLLACLEYGGNVPAVIQLENVPRITSRGKPLLSKIKKMLIKFGYAVDIRADHNLGEIGGLGQNRIRFLIKARHEAQIPNVIYYPEKKPLRSIGNVLENLPEPGDIVAGGPLHKLPRLQWKTWMRLALIPAGGDWRDLNKVDWENLRVVHEPRRGAFEVADWDKPSRAVTSTAGPGRSNGVTAISDPRLQINGDGKTNLFRVQLNNDPETCITGAAGPHQGAANISDPKLTNREGRHPGVYRIVPADEPAPCVTGTRFGSGAIAVADPRVKTKLHPDSYGVQDWNATSKTVRAANRIMQAAGSVSDPRVADRPGRYTDQFRMQSVHSPAATVTGSTDVQNGAQLIADPNVAGQYHDGAYRVSEWENTSPTVTTGGVSAGQGKVIADPRFNSSPRADTMGILDWDQPSKTVIGSADVHAAAVAVADPRIPADNEQGVWTIISLDGTRHRPLTTFELAMIQSFPQTLPDGRPFQLEGCSDAKAREYIGNAVPPDAEEEMGNCILTAAAEADAGVSFQLSWNEVWVTPVLEETPAFVH